LVTVGGPQVKKWDNFSWPWLIWTGN
jgi:hypothetical protein